MPKFQKSVLMLVLGTLTLGSNVALAQDRTGLEPSVAVLVGSVSPDPSGTSTDWGYGVELGANCQLLQPANGVLRHQLSVTRYSEDPLRMTSTEFNTHWLFDTAPGLQLGFGPGIGYVRAELGDEKNSVWAAQVGGSLRYSLDNDLFLGVEARYQFTGSDRYRGRSEDVDNFRVMGKVGMNF